MANDTSAHFTGKEEILICFSHLRWHFVFQRPQHLLSRAARSRRVYFVEEPVFVDEPAPISPHISSPVPSVEVVVPFISHQRRAEAAELQRAIVADILARHPGADVILWYYTPMAMLFTRDIAACAIVYDCMDELSGFLGAPPELGRLERALFDKADLVFTGGRSLYEAKRKQHRNVRAFPSSIDKAHFAPARDGSLGEPADQAAIAHPRIGYFGVVDERMDLRLLDALAALRPQWRFVMIGPVVKVHPDSLPKRPNIHWLGPKAYDELPAYLTGWDAGFMPFALNDATRYISPTKTPEFLAAGVPVASTPIADVVDAYDKFKVVAIAAEPEAFASALEALMSDADPRRFAAADAFLAQQSWDTVWLEMERLIEAARVSKPQAAAAIRAA